MTQRRTRSTPSVTASGFAQLLRRLDADPDRAASEYERLRHTLVKFFDWRGAWPPDDCADETIDRLVAKLGREIPIDDVRRYAHGIARLVLLERRRREAQAPLEDHPDLANLPVADIAPTSPLHRCFERCLAALPDEQRILVLQYHTNERQAKIDHRRQLARSLGISENALRSRVHRICHALEQTVLRCVAAAEKQGLDAALRHVTDALRTSQVDTSHVD
jgi:DNA-directed RNA polymerase specialized sigma24 family protein